LITDLRAEFDFAFPRDTRGDSSGGNTPRLKDNDAFRAG
jgi:hypothetical protein